jgi:cyclohexadieny/prephenate dehydrogenase
VPDKLGPALAKPLFERLTLIGLGLIGSSIARAARRVNAAASIAAGDADPKVRDRVRELGLVDHVAATLAESVRDADLVILCVPIGAYAAVADEIAPHLKSGAIVSDVGSVKSAVIAALSPRLPKSARLVPAHPVAGTEHSGPDAGFETLFRRRWCVLTPAEGADPAAVRLVKEFWEVLGSNVELMSAAHHDLVLAITSHVPHLIAYNIVGTAADLEEVTSLEVMKFSAGGFRDFTRIAASDPTMWRDVFLYNKDAVLEVLGRFNEDLAALQRMIRWGEGDGLFELFTRTRAIRRGIIEQGQETAAPDFGRRATENGEAGR